MIPQSWMLWSRSLLSQNRKTLILLTRTLTLTTVGSQVSQRSKHHRIGTGQAHLHIISLQEKAKAKVQEDRNLPATGIEAKMTGRSMTVVTISHAPVLAHSFHQTRAAIAERQDTGAMSVPLSLVWLLSSLDRPLSTRDRTLLPLRSSERERMTALLRQKLMRC